MAATRSANSFPIRSISRLRKLSKSELIEKSSGHVLCDLTRDDIGFGPNREGSVLWSPDSKRFAYLSSNLTVPAGNLFSKPPPAGQEK